MKTNNKGRLLRSVEFAGFAGFFVILFVYIYKVTEPAILYEKFARGIFFEPFYVGWDFFRGLVAVPGGLGDYANSFLSQWFYCNLGGAVIVTLLGMSAYLAFRWILSIFSSSRWHFVCFAPAIAIAAINSAYDHLLIYCLTAILSMLLAAIFIKAAPAKPAVRFALFVVVFAACYYMLSAGSFLFALLVVVYELTVSRKFLWSACMLSAAGVIAYLIGIGIYFLSVEDAFLENIVTAKWLSKTAIAAYWVMYGFILLTVLVAGILHGRRDENSKASSSVRVFLTAVIQAVVVIAVSTAAVWYSFDSRQKIYYKCSYLAFNKQWDALLTHVDQNRYLLGNLYCNNVYTRALCHTDKLGKRQFTYPPIPDALILSIDQEMKNNEFYVKTSDVMMELGYINNAEKNCYELIELAGNWPCAVRHLVMINLAKGKTDTAKVFLARLSDNMLQGKWARDMLKELERNPKLAGNKELQYLRSIAIDGTEDFDEEDVTKDFYCRLLAKNPKNKMAFQYMMAEYLFKGDLTKIADNIGRLDDLGYTSIPKYCKQALVIYSVQNPDKPLPAKWRPSEKAFKQSEDFLKAYTLYKDNEEVAKRALKPKFGNSYYYYFAYIVSGEKK